MKNKKQKIKNENVKNLVRTPPKGVMNPQHGWDGSSPVPALSNQTYV